MKKESIKHILDKAYLKHNAEGFIASDPISLPHLFTQKEDIEIIGFLVAIIAWGQRISIINNGLKLIEIFDHAPHQFITQHTDNDLKKCLKFVHRTFNDTDLLCLIGFLKEIYEEKGGLEKAFSKHLSAKDKTIEKTLNGFRFDFEKSTNYIQRSSKHIAHPNGGSACKRLNMYLRWMVRKDQFGVDFGIWQSIKPAQLICPLDVHVIRTATQLGLLSNAKSDWKTAIILTEKLRKFDPQDPVKYDFALFGIGVNG